MLGYIENNINPKHRKTGDCSVRALASTLGISWEEAIKEMYDVAVKTGYMISCKENYEKVLAKHGWVKKAQPKKANGTKYMVNELDSLLVGEQKNHPVFVRMANHCTCVIDGKINDIWNCGYKTVGNYYVKEN